MSNEMMKTRFSWIVAPALAFLVASPPAWPHAILVGSSPEDQATLRAAPANATLQFNSRIEKKVSQVALLDSQGNKVPLPKAGGYPAGGANTLVIPLPGGLPSGQYRLQYRVLAVDGHATPGRIRFTVDGAGTP